MIGVFDLFSKRQSALRGEVPDVYTYDDIPQKLRVQIIHIIQSFTKKEYYDRGKFLTRSHVARGNAYENPNYQKRSTSNRPSTPS